MHYRPRLGIRGREIEMTNRDKQLWDVINEGGEGYRPDYAMRNAAPVVARKVVADTILKDSKGRPVPRSKVEGWLAADLARLDKITDATARAITERAIAEYRATLGG